MQTLSEETMQMIYNSLPEDLKDAIFSPESMDVYNQIQSRYGLDPHQREELSIQSGLLMMGITEPKEYVLVLAEKLGVPRDKAAFIAQEVNRNIFHPVRDSLKEVHQPLTEMPPSEASASVPSVPASVFPTAPAIPPAPSSIFNQKLGTTFRVTTPPQTDVPNYSQVPPPVETPVVPPPPPNTPRASDPYREPPR